MGDGEVTTTSGTVTTQESNPATEQEEILRTLSQDAPSSPMLQELITRIHVPYPIILVNTEDEDRVIAGLLNHLVGRKEDRTYKADQDVYIWSLTQGLCKIKPNIKSMKRLCEQEQSLDESEDSLEVLNWISGTGTHKGSGMKPSKAKGLKRSIFILRDFHKEFMNRIDVVRKLKDIYHKLMLDENILVLLAPQSELPPELSKIISVVEMDLPTHDEIKHIIDFHLACLRRAISIGETSLQVSKEDVRELRNYKLEYTDDEMNALIDAFLGLTSTEAVSVIGRSFETHSELDVGTILSEKEQIVAKNGILEFWKPTETMDSVGGLNEVKKYLRETKYALGPGAREFGVDYPRGILLLGKPGSAKSLLVKASASYFQVPILRLDIGKVMQGLVGSSEENIRKALQTAEAVAPCILWIDEIEKAVSGTGSSNFSDAGTMSRVFGTLVHWMQDRKGAVYVMATANNIAQLPPELTRKGRIDELWYVDLPVKVEKEQIFTIHLSKRGRDPSRFDLDMLSDISYERGGTHYQYSGAEIEAAVQYAIRRAWADAAAKREKAVPNGENDITDELLADSLKTIVPLSCTYEKEMKDMRSWAVKKARFASRLVEDAVLGDQAGYSHTKDDVNLDTDLDVSSSKATGSKGASKAEILEP